MDDLARERQRIFMWEVKRWVGAPYIWGGQGNFDDGIDDGVVDEAGLDCSGLVLEGLIAAGDVPKGTDMTANDLWEKYKQYGITVPREGALAFWCRGGRAYHVAICVGRYHCITADGGGSGIKTTKDAVQNNAYIRLLPIMHRRVQPRFVHIWKG